MLKKLLLISICGLAFSCVSTKKYKILEAENSSQSNTISKLKIAQEKGEISAAELKKTQELLNGTELSLSELHSKNDALQESYNLLEKAYEETLLQNAELLDVTSKEKSDLNLLLSKKTEELNKQEKLLADRLESIKKSEAKIASLEELLNNERSKMDSLQTSISNALFVFGPSDLSVYQKEGKIYVSLSQKLLFSKGSDALDANGKNALEKLAAVLKERNDINVMVEGHTDPDGTPEKNWDLSTKRATTIVKLLQKSGVSPENLTASGRAFYDPLVENDSEDNKSKNRRTEIILSPKLDQIMQLLRHN